MAELWLPSEDRLARWDPTAEQIRITGWRPGPAGVSAVDLADGLRVVVDHASPTTLTELSVDVVRGRVADAHLEPLVHLLGAEPVELLRPLPAGRRDGRPLRLPSTRRYLDDLERRRDGDEHLTFARMVLGADLGDDADLADTLRPVALLESALLAFDLHHFFAVDLARRGLDVLEEVGRPHDMKVAYQLASILRTIADRAATHPVGRVAARWSQRLTDPDHARRDRFMAAAAMSPLAEMAAAPASRLAAPTPGPAVPPRPERPLPVGGDHRGWAWLDGGNNVVVSAPGAPPGTWARVFRSTDRLLLGLSPLRGVENGTAKALVVIPPTQADDLRVDIVDDASTPLRALAHDEVRRAVLLGREAARLSRLGSPDADHAWKACATLWDALGDTQRANLARQHGRREPRTSPRGRSAQMQALLVDGLR